MYIKNRRGKYVNIRIWSYVDLGTCRMEDLFITDGNLNELTDCEVKEISYLIMKKLLKLVQN